MQDLTAVGLGLDFDALRFGRTTEAWLIAGSKLRDQVKDALNGVNVKVELIGSASVLGLLAKPIIDLAVGSAGTNSVDLSKARLDAAGWNYRRDAGADGGHVFVLEARPWHRVAHLHLVEYNGTQWRNYLDLRDLLRRSPEARQRYEAVKLSLAAQCRGDRGAYTNGKSEVVTSLIRDDA